MSSLATAMSGAFLASVMSNVAPGARAQIAPARGDCGVQTLDAGLVDVTSGGGSVTRITPINVTIQQPAAESTNADVVVRPPGARGVRIEPAAGHRLSTRRFEHEAEARRRRAAATTGFFSSSLMMKRSLIFACAVVGLVAAAKLLLYLVSSGVIGIGHMVFVMVCLFIAGWHFQSGKMAATNRMNTEFWSTQALGPESSSQRRARVRQELTPREVFMRECMAPDLTVRCNNHYSLPRLPRQLTLATAGW